MIGALFVDDEPRVLDGLRRMLRSRRAAWDVRFAATGRQALAVLAEGRADVVISDMRMPEIDGARLFAEIERLYPETARIMLTGQSNYEAALRLVGPPQIFLSKPCDGAQLTRAVEQAIALRRRLNRPALSAAVKGLRRNERLTPAYFDIRRELLRERPCADRVAARIEADPEFERAFLRAAGIVWLDGRPAVRAGQAISCLKPEKFCAGIVAASILSLVMDSAGAARAEIDRLIGDATRTAELGLRVSRIHGFGAGPGAAIFLAGLLHNVGAVALAAGASGERNAGYGEIGGCLLAEYGLPDALVEAVTYQDEPGQCLDPQSPALTALHVAKKLAACPDALEADGTRRVSADTAALDLDFLQRQGFRLRPEAYLDSTGAFSGR